MITLLWSALKYDIELHTFQTSQMRMSDRPQGVDKRNYDEITTDDSLEDIILRYCETGTARLYSIFNDKLQGGSVAAGTNANDGLKHAIFGWEFDFKDNKIQERAMAMLMHRFVVAYALYRWAKTFYPSEANQHLQESEGLIKEIKNNLYDMPYPVKEHKTPITTEIEVTVN